MLWLSWYVVSFLTENGTVKFFRKICTHAPPRKQTHSHPPTEVETPIRQEGLCTKPRLGSIPHTLSELKAAGPGMACTAGWFHGGSRRGAQGCGGRVAGRRGANGPNDGATPAATNVSAGESTA